MSSTDIYIRLHNQILCSYISDIHKKDGFLADPSKHPKANAYNILQNKLYSQLTTVPKNLSFHNLCSNCDTPSGNELILGLGHKFCLEPKTPRGSIVDTIDGLKRNARIKNWLLNNSTDENYIPGLYIPSETAMPPGPPDVENCLLNFTHHYIQLIL